MTELPELDPEALDQLIANFQKHFPDFDRFDRDEGRYFDKEREYKDAFRENFIEHVAPMLESATVTDEGQAHALFLALVDALTAKVGKFNVSQNMVSWRGFDHMKKMSGSAAVNAAQALQALWSDSAAPEDRMETFAQSYKAAFEEAGADGGVNGITCVLGTLILALKQPNDAIIVRRQLWSYVARTLTGGIIFHNNPVTADEYRAALSVARQVFQKFESLGWEPSDFWDVHNFFWVTLSGLYPDVEGSVENDPEARRSAAQSVSEGKAEPMQSRNLILYGPPGTGKTYRTALEAVRICVGEEEAQEFLGSERREQLMQRYRELVAVGRISFVTFHQSFSYEEFVEGLRPDTAGSNELGPPAEGGASGGFRLKVYDGIFKKVCEQARLNHGSDDDGERMGRSNYVMRLGLPGSRWREAFDASIATGTIEWHHGGDYDWSPVEYEDWEAIKEKRRQDDPEILGNMPGVYGTWLVRAGMEAGDLVVLTVGKRKIVAVGRISGDYEYRPPSDEHPARHLRPVTWLWSDRDGVDREGIYGNDFTAFHPAYTLNKEALDRSGLDRLLRGEPTLGDGQDLQSHVLIIDEINRANISKVFGELITLLELDKRIGETNEIRLILPYSNELFGVPPNLSIIGTMNTADRSIALLDTALRRRFEFEELLPEPDILPIVDGVDLSVVLSCLNERIEYLFDRDHQIGHAYFLQCSDRSSIDLVMRNKVIPLIAEYFHEDWEKVREVLGETTEEGRFICRLPLQPPSSMPDADLEEVRYRYQVRASFGRDAYDAFS
jgi:AAA domain (dynein-related subfamily)